MNAAANRSTSCYKLTSTIRSVSEGRAIIEVDCETTGLQPWSGRHKAFLWTFSSEPEGADAEALIPGRDDRRINWWFARAAQEGARAWNTKFDRAFADVGGYDIPGDGVWHDGMVLAHIVNERRSLKLKDVADSLFGPDASDLQKQVKAYLTQERARRAKEARDNGTELVEPNYSDVPDDIIIPYGLEDVRLTRRVCDVEEAKLQMHPSLAELYDFEMEVLDALYAMEKRGLPADREGYAKLEVEVVDNLERLEHRCIELAREGLGSDAEFNPKSSAQIIQALKARGADMSFMETSDGEIKSADKENLEAVDDELAAAILDFRAEEKVHSTYVRPMIHRHYDSSIRSWVEPFIAPDERIHANYRQVGARTGRMSCSGPNMQNQPRDDLRLRYNIVAEPGHKLVTCDLSNIEMRLFAAYSGDGKLLEAARNGTDFHDLTARMMMLTDRTRAGGSVESARQRAKILNFAIIYGIGAKGIKKQQRVDMNQARLMRRRYFEAYPEARRLMGRIEAKLHNQGYITGLWGRRYRAENASREAYKFTNYLVQGTAADLLKQALVRLHADGVPVVGLVHDEVLAHVPEKDAEEVKHLIVKRLTEHDDRLNGIVPLEADGDIVDRWSQAKKPEFVPNWARG